MTFQELGLIDPILRALAAEGYETPSPIQQKAIVPALAGRDVLGCAQTGTGKTCAFAAPILQRLNAAPAKNHPIRALILTPTRELALQIQESFAAYGRFLPLRCAVIFGGVGQQPQVDKLRAGVDILVATPGRLEDLHSQGYIHVENLEIFVLDEADRMLDMGFIHDVQKILRWLPKKKQTLFFSATMPPEVRGLVDSLLVNPVKVAVDPISSPVEVIEQRLYYVDRGSKTKLLAHLIREEGVKNALVFTRTKHGANKVAGDLSKAGVTAAAIHGNKSQTARQQALADFKAGRVQILVATDIAARGIDIEELSHVFNYNLPDVPETYVHRIGRTGRAGHEGAAFSFCDINEKEELKGIERLLGRPIPVVEGHPWPMEVFEPLPKDKRGRVVNPEDAEARAAARERRRARDAASRAAAQAEQSASAKAEPKTAKPAPESPASKSKRAKKSNAQEKKAETPSPEQARPQMDAQLPMEKKKARGYRASATLEEALTATAPSIQMYESTDVFEFKKPNPLDSDVIMDATARLLAPRQGIPSAPAKASTVQGEQSTSRRRRRSGSRSKAEASTAPKSAKAEPKTAKPAPEGSTPKSKRAKKSDAQAKKPRASHPGRNHSPERHSGTQKDSTEQPSLMKPYYLSDD